MSACTSHARIRGTATDRTRSQAGISASDRRLGCGQDSATAPYRSTSTAAGCTTSPARRTWWPGPASRRSPPGGTSPRPRPATGAVRQPALPARAGAERSRPGRSPRDDGSTDRQHRLAGARFGPSGEGRVLHQGRWSAPRGERRGAAEEMREECGCGVAGHRYCCRHGDVSLVPVWWGTAGTPSPGHTPVAPLPAGRPSRRREVRRRICDA